MEVVAVRTPGSVLAALEIRADLSMVERRPQTIGGGLSLAVASAGTEVLLTATAARDAEAMIILRDDSELPGFASSGFAVGTARFQAVEFDESGLWAKPIRHGVVQAGDVVRIISGSLDSKGKPFPRIPDGLPDAPENRERRFTPAYEARAESLWKGIAGLGYEPSFEWAGSEDGEAIVARGDDDTVLVVIDLEDPGQQQMIDLLTSGGDLTEWLKDELAGRPTEQQ